MPVALSIIPIDGIGEIRPGDELAELIADAATAQGTPLADGDCLVVTQKIVSKAEGRLVPLDPADLDARRRLVESESVRIVRRRGDLIISETRARLRVRERGHRPLERRGRAGPRCSPSTPTGRPSTCATRCAPGPASTSRVIVSDTFGRPWRQGLTDVAIGVSGIAAIVDLRDTPDAPGRVLQVTEVAIADEIAAAAELVMGKAPACRSRSCAASTRRGSARARCASCPPAAGRPLPMSVVPRSSKRRRRSARSVAEPVDRACSTRSSRPRASRPRRITRGRGASS